jgi:glycosyltransferase involved in cell wall biosynthesis
MSVHNITHIFGYPTKRGAQILVKNLAMHPALSEFTHSAVFLMDNNGGADKDFEALGVKTRFCLVSQFPYVPSYRLRIALRNILFRGKLSQVISSLQADIVHNHLPLYLPHTASTVIKHNQKCFISTFHSCATNGYYVSPQLKQFASLVNSHPCTAVTCVSNAVKTSFSLDQLILPEKIDTVYNGIDVHVNPSLKVSHVLWCQKLGIPVNSLIFGTLGSLSYEKGHAVLLDALSILNSGTGERNYLVIAGDGVLRDELALQVSSKGLNEYVRFLGFQEQVLEFLMHLDVFVFPSLAEGFGLALIEAGLAGIPCIASNIGGITEIAYPDGAMLVEPYSSIDLAEKMKIMMQKETRDHFAVNARKMAQRFSIDETAEKYAMLYKSLLKC